jgi:hypothetical protein
VALTITIAGTDRTTRILTSGNRRTVRLNYGLGSDWTAEFPFFDSDSTSSAIRPAIDDTVVIAEDATTIFSGRVVSVRDQPLGGFDAGTVTIIRANHKSEALDRIIVDESYAAGMTLEAILNDLQTNYLAAFSITMHASQPTGPTLEAQEFDNVSMKAVLNHLMDITGYVPQVNAAGTTLIMGQPGVTLTAAYSITSANGKATSPITWTKERVSYANRVIVRYGTETVVRKTLTLTGDGVDTAWPIDYDAIYNNGTVSSQGYVVDDGVFTPMYTGTWSFDSGTGPHGSLTRSPAMPNTKVATWGFDVQFPQTVTAEDSADITAKGVYALTVDYPDVFDFDQATEIADGLLRNKKIAPKIVTVSTREALELPGTTITLTFTARTISGSYLITNVRAEDTLDGQMLYTFTCVEGSEAQRGWLEYFRSAVGGGASSGGRTTGSIVPIFSGSFPDDVVANMGQDDGVTGPAESSLRGRHINASVAGPGVALGTLGSSLSWAIIANHINPSPLRRALAFIPLEESSSLRWAAAISQEATSPTAAEYWLIPNAAGKLYVGGSTAAFGVGYQIENVYTKEVRNSGSYYESARTNGVGKRYTRTFAAGNYTADTGANWTLASGDVITESFDRVGDRLTVHFYYQTTTVATTPAYLKMALPDSLTVAVTTFVTCQCFIGGRWDRAICYAGAGDAFLRFYRDTDATSSDASDTASGGLPSFTLLWPNETNLTYVAGQISIYTA